MISDEELSERFPDIRMDYENKHFCRGLLGRQLLLSQCADCGRWSGKPRALCPQCWRWCMRPVPVSGHGTIAPITYLHQGPPAPGVDYARQYPLVAVDAADQPLVRFSSTLIPAGTDAVVGDAVELVWAGRPLPAFRPASIRRAYRCCFVVAGCRYRNRHDTLTPAVVGHSRYFDESGAPAAALSAGQRGFS